MRNKWKAVTQGYIAMVTLSRPLFGCLSLLSVALNIIIIQRSVAHLQTHFRTKCAFQVRCWKSCCAISERVLPSRKTGKKFCWSSCGAFTIEQTESNLHLDCLLIPDFERHKLPQNHPTFTSAFGNKSGLTRK
jgi:hypothetical protein